MAFTWAIFGLAKANGTYDIRVPMFVMGPEIAPGATSNLLGSHVDLSPTFLALAGLDPAPEMDGRSVLNQLINNPTDPKWCDPVKRQSAKEKALATPQLRPAQSVYVEYHGLGPVGAPHRYLDLNNIFRAIRFVNDAIYGNVVYAEWGSDFNFAHTVFVEVFDLNVDPWQMHNVVNKTSSADLSAWKDSVSKLYACKGESCR